MNSFYELRSTRAAGLVCLAITAFGWGLNWPVMKLLLREWPPLLARGSAGLIAAVGLAAFAVSRRESLKPPARSIGLLSVAAFFNVFAWMGFSTLAMVWLNVAEGSLLVYTMPLWVILLTWAALGVRPRPSSMAAVGIGAGGILVLLLDSEIALGAEKAPGVLFAIGAAVLFAAGVVTRRVPINMPPVALTAWQVGLGSAPMVLLGLGLEGPGVGSLSSVGWACMIYMTIVPMGLCYLCWFGATQRLPAAMTSTSMLLVPLVGVVSAAFVVGEPLGTREVLALGLILSGVGLSLRSAEEQQQKAPPIV